MSRRYNYIKTPSLCRSGVCDRDAERGRGGLCRAHWKQENRGYEFSPISERKRTSNEDRQEIRRLRDQGQTYEQIADGLGVKFATVYDVINGAKRRRSQGLGPQLEVSVTARCPRCLLALPHEGCLPTIADLASSRRGEAAGD